ncbi:transmembrane and coiled-coil domains protein 1 isoform X4 [Clupea harengus]|uniref:Transmembrane and coiled-coil domains protein 1 isoform X4 n=1 Tax=Clupea harengus TaxID=7950 RepID=A0A6P8G3I9_CLUHA|nr:transmembrane and coiled-coil domains protein 1 isoform X4 [Clupea harengus]
MKKGASLPNHRPKPGAPATAADMTDGPPMQRSSPLHGRRHFTMSALTASHDAHQQPRCRPRSSSTDGGIPMDTSLSSGYQSTEETERIERLDGGVQAALAGAGEISDEALDPQRLRQVIAQLQQKILKLTEQLRIEQTVRDENVAEYLKLANNSSDKQQSVRIKQVFEKKNQKSAGSIAQLQRKLEHYHRRLREAEQGGAGAAARQPKAVLRDMQQGLRDVGARVSEFSEGVVDSVRGGISSIQQVTHQAAARPREIATLLLASRNRTGSTDNLHQQAGVDIETNGEEGVLGGSGRFQASPKYGSEEDCSSGTSGSAGANSTTGGAPGGPPSSKGNTLERGQNGSFDMLLQEVQELREAQGRMEEALEGLKSHYTRDYTLIMQGLQEERFRCERLEEQLNDLTELHQNEILNLKQELASMEEKIAYQSNERARDIQEALEACQTRVSKMELQQQQVVQLEGLESGAAARTLLGKLISVLLALMAVLLVFVSALANCVVPLMKTRGRSLSTLLFLLLLAFLWRNWDVLAGQTQARVHIPS